MTSFEQKHMYLVIKRKSLTYFRYIDDIFLIQKGIKNELGHFPKDLNKNHPSINFDYKVLKFALDSQILKYMTEMYV